jgi:hypothetical protein
MELYSPNDIRTMPGISLSCAAMRSHGVGLILGEAKQTQHVGVSAEASAAHADPVLVSKDGGDEEVRYPLQFEGNRSEALSGRLRPRVPVDADAWHLTQAEQGVASELRLVRRDCIHPDFGQLVQRDPEGDGADDVRAAGLLAIGGLGPDDLIQRHDLDRSTAALFGIPMFEDIAPATRAPVPNGA